MMRNSFATGARLGGLLDRVRVDKARAHHRSRSVLASPLKPLQRSMAELDKALLQLPHAERSKEEALRLASNSPARLEMTDKEQRSNSGTEPTTERCQSWDLRAAPGVDPVSWTRHP
jgi:hypothetical protein